MTSFNQNHNYKGVPKALKQILMSFSITPVQTMQQ